MSDLVFFWNFSDRPYLSKYFGSDVIVIVFCFYGWWLVSLEEYIWILNNIWNNLEHSQEWSCQTQPITDMARHNITTHYRTIIIWIWTASNFLIASQSSHLQRSACQGNITSTDFIEILHASELQAAAAIFTVYYWRDGTKTALQDIALGHTSLSCLATLRGGEVCKT